ncbi:MAG: hypothetical protein QOE03_2987 [Micromonosporaceae bacterium]|nr:hypothetical protein [Micromonosporaceae bacterium]
MTGGSSINRPLSPDAASRKLSIRSIGGSIRARFHATRAGRVAFRVLIAAAGLALIVLGLLLVPLPGPGWLIVLGGVAVWAIEFTWARRLLRYLRERLRRWNEWTRRQHRLVRIPVALALLAVVGVAAWLSLKHGLGIDPLDRLFGVDRASGPGVDPVR